MAKRRKTTKDTRIKLYAASQYLDLSVEKELGLQIPLDVYLQDPLVGKKDPKFGFDKDFYVCWEPGIADGPTSARFAVVDYNGDTGHVAPKAQWDSDNDRFLGPDGKALDKKNTKPLQFHQVNVWAILQRALEFFEQGQGLGRRIPYGFDGNRLIVVPHAGYGRNAFYDRTSKSLQFYYFDHEGETVYTCLSTDIINHEFGHALLDGIRPYFFESSQVQTGAFHEFLGDLTAILIILRNNKFRSLLAKTTKGDLAAADHLVYIAEQFGQAVTEQEYLRTAQNDETMSSVADDAGPHRVSEVLTGAMFDILLALSTHYIEDREQSAKKAFWNAIQRMQRMAIQPLDLLPPVDVTFRDYALAVLRAEELSNPTDPFGHFNLMLKAFLKRGILDKDDEEALREERYLYERLRLSVFHDIDNISRSRAGAYRFLDDNRDKLFIPANQDVVVVDLYDANKLTREGRRLPRQIILEYLWREEVKLEGEQFGEYNGETTTMLCGGTLVFDQNGTLLSWFRKPGTQGGSGKAWKDEIKKGEQRRADLLADLARRITAGHIGAVLGSGKGMLGSQVPPLTVRKENGALRFELSPHLNLTGEDHEHYKGGQQWEVSS
ncbi:MAG: gluzincin family metallopeptidase [Planctomycetota bacterium]|jgi:hypothetical protein